MSGGWNIDQLRADTFTAEFRWDFGVDEGDDAIRDFVVGRGQMTFDHKFVAILRGVVDDLGHDNSCLGFADLSHPDYQAGPIPTTI